MAEKERTISHGQYTDVL